MLEEQITSYADFPNEETKYQQNMEEMKQLIPFLKEELKSCPNESLVFTLIETIDFYSLKRYFKLKSNSSSDNEELSKYKENLLANISNLDSFVVIPKKNSPELEGCKNKGSQFVSPSVFNIDGDEGRVDIDGEEKILFIYDNLEILNLFLEKNKNSEKKIICLGVNPQFFEQKKYLKKNGFLNKSTLQFYFINSENSNCTLNIKNLPRLLVIDDNNIITEEKMIKDINCIEIEKILVKNKDNNDMNNEEKRKKDSNFILLENDNKRKVIKAINIYMSEIGLTEVHFYVKSKISIDKKGITKTKCYPVFYGDANKEGKDLVDVVINTLNGQELFHDIQNKVNII